MPDKSILRSVYSYLMFKEIQLIIAVKPWVQASMRLLVTLSTQSQKLRDRGITVFTWVPSLSYSI